MWENLICINIFMLWVKVKLNNIWIQNIRYEINFIKFISPNNKQKHSHMSETLEINDLHAYKLFSTW